LQRGLSDSKRRENYVYVAVYHQNAEKNNNIKVANRSLENVAQFGYLGTTVPNQNFIQETLRGD
jgi:hypothetical protein